MTAQPLRKRLEARATELERKAANFRKHYPQEALTADLEEGLALASDLREAVGVLDDLAAELKTRTVENECMQASLQAITAKYQAMQEALNRLGSMEAFVVGGLIDPRRDAELAARINYARRARAEQAS